MSVLAEHIPKPKPEPKPKVDNFTKFMPVSTNVTIHY